MNKPWQVAGSLFVLALVGVISLTASNYLRADGDDDDSGGSIPVPLPVISAAPLLVAAPAPIPVVGAVSVARTDWEYLVLDSNGMMGNPPPGFSYWPQELQTTKYNVLAAAGWEFVEFQYILATGQSLWIWRRPRP